MTSNARYVSGPAPAPEWAGPPFPDENDPITIVGLKQNPPDENGKARGELWSNNENPGAVAGILLRGAGMVIKGATGRAPEITIDGVTVYGAELGD